MNQQPLYTGPRQQPQVTNGSREGSFGRHDARQPAPLENNQSLAARFEDEKRRIIESCFHKRDPDGMQLESYITHVKVTEDASYPSSPPPPESPPVNKKPRVILVAVRRSGKVRVHKARENPNGTFSIGKTWSLDELIAITSYSGMVPATPQQQTEKQWASNTGFIVTLGKPYFWSADTAKEKDFFIASLIKIYRKYTGGRIPELIGFGPHEVAQLTGSQSSHSTQNQHTALSPIIPSDRGHHPPPPPAIPALSANRPQSPYSTGQAPPSRDGSAIDPHERERGLRPQGYNTASTDGPPVRNENRPPGRPDRDQRVPEPPRAQPYGTTHFRRDDGRMPSLSDSLHPNSSRPSISPKTSQTSLQRSEASLEPAPLRPNGLGTAKLSGPDYLGKRLVPTPGQEAARNAGENESFNNRRPSPAVNDRKAPEPVPSIPAQDSQPSPERKKPPPTVADPQPDHPGPPSPDNSAFVTPLGTPSGLQEEEQPKKDAGYFSSQKSQPDSEPNSAALPKNAISEPVASESTHHKITNEAITAEPTEVAVPPKVEEEHRPGLGPMIKKKSEKDIANRFRRAALAATAFQPRQGGAAARLKAMQERQSNEPDGITSVVPAPLLRGMSTDSTRSGTPDLPNPSNEKSQAVPKPAQSEPVPKIQLERAATSDTGALAVTPAAVKSADVTPAAATPSTVPTPAKPDASRQERAESPDKARSRSPQRRRRQKLEAEVEKHCAILGIDPRILDGRGADFNELLTEFGWEGRLPSQQKVEDFETDIRREIGRAQASGWLGHLEQQESKVQELAMAFDNAIAECEELDGLLTLYAHELDTLHDDIEYIEAQGQGLQVQTANQKLLHSELQNLLKTLTISSGDLRPLHAASIDSLDGVQAIERSLSLLYGAMLTIDPDIRHNKARQEAASAGGTVVPVYADKTIAQMRAVQQRKDEYKHESAIFINRFNQHMKAMFQMAEQRTSEENTGSISSGTTITLNLRAVTVSRQDLWVYHVLMLFVREVNPYEWQTLIKNYEITVKTIFQEQFRDFSMNLRRTARKATGEEQEILFTHQEKEKVEESLTSAARKLTVRRAKTSKTSTLRQSMGDKREGKPEAWVVFDKALEQQATAISEEQNFIVHFFHIESQSSADFAEVVQSQPPAQRKVPDLQVKQSHEPDRGMAKIVQESTEGIYGFWVKDLQSLVDWVLRTDQLQGVGILVSLEQCLARYEETNQEFITRTVRVVHERVIGLFHKFVEEQVKAIEETKVKVKKRKGLISFMRVFPDFSAAVEEMVPQQEFAHQDSLEVRFVVNDAYTKLLKAMWDSLSFIAKDNPASSSGAVHSATPANGDPEDKEALNYHILLIENMNYFAEEVKTQHNVVLEEWSERASRDQLMHLAQYTDAVIRRPLGKWLDFLESTEALMKSTDSYAAIANRPSHSRSSAKKMLATYDSKEVRKGIETLKRRIEKHFTDADDPSSSSSKALIGRVFDECSTRYTHAYDRMKLVIDRVYDSNLEIDWRKEDAAAMFRR
ncbi:hypothetical protein A1O3_06254 [Capronia epimyces CBS 606.96]|uniref:Exocyst complex component Sec3 PIP2-binding N-terminal domain-containing protein n=1 Tax=Capronia epimyces CBS 606.96 TaxID=1182542 RepID=W9XZQ1_9EURO|nr:uncharacterized protein A1O3_06254 [Capronia epimyces CBS 606.96]EXJ82441.1 hypothetical protein A1O3_06254 [Capronia epimyces CBS 606.96]